MNIYFQSIITLSFIFTLTPNANALQESQVYEQITDFIVHGKTCSDGSKFWKVHTLKTPRHLRTRPYGVNKQGFSVREKKQGEYGYRYSQFGCELGEKGVLVIGPGRSEGSPEYYETAIDYIAAGYSPVYVMDHRGQGLSPRLLENHSKGHLVNFFHYINDFKMAVDKIVDDVKSRQEYNDQDFFYTSNSMGGAIGLGYFQHFSQESPFKAAALLGSMIKVNYLSFIDKEPTKFNNFVYSERGVIAQSKFFCVTGRCDHYSNEELFGDYVPENRIFQADTESIMTHSEARFNIRTFLWNQFDWRTFMREHYSEDENWEKPILGGATMGWSLASTYFLQDMRSKGEIEKLPNTPILLITGTRDLRAYTPHLDGSTDLDSHRDFCDNVNRWNSHGNAELCEFYPLEGSFHEIYKETDQYRDAAMTKVLEFFEANSTL